MAALEIPIPAGFAAHWKIRPDGVMEVELMLVLSLSNARWLAVKEAARGAVRNDPQ
jgi:hypothetical protein